MPIESAVSPDVSINASGDLDTDIRVFGGVVRVREVYQRGLADARAQKNTVQDVVWSIRMMDLHRIQGLFKGAEHHLKHALDVVRCGGHVDLEEVLVGSLGRIAFDRGRLDEARGCFEDALQMARHESNKLHEMMWLTKLAAVDREEQRFDEARGLIQRALELSRQLLDRRGEVEVLIALGELSLAQRQHYSARQHLAAAAAVLGEVESPLNAAFLTVFRGQLTHAMGDLDAARACLVLGRQHVENFQMTPDAALTKQLVQL